MKHWWKILAAVLVLYALVAGMIIPLRSGIVSDKTSLSLTAGQEKVLNIFFYNARFDAATQQNIKVRVRLSKEKTICANAVKVVDARTLAATFSTPSTINPKSIEEPFPLLEVESPGNGYAFSPIFIRSADSSAAAIEEKSCDAAPMAQTKRVTFPFLNILEESIRNLFYHVPMWFGMMLILLVSMIFSIRQLNRPDGLRNARGAKAFAGVGVLYGILGVVTGAIWAKHTWGAYWSWDVKQNSSAVALLIYLAYFVLRSSFDDADKRARISAVYNIFAFATLIPLLYVIPRISDSLHPGAEGNPAFSSYDLDSALRLVFYPAVIGWILLGVWIATLWMRIEKIWQRKMEAVG